MTRRQHTVQQLNKKLLDFQQRVARITVTKCVAELKQVFVSQPELIKEIDDLGKKLADSVESGKSSSKEWKLL